MKQNIGRLLPEIESFFINLGQDNLIVNETRKNELDRLVSYVNKGVNKKKPIRLIFICTHNSRRSHMGQLWAQAASVYYNIPNIICYSGGTEETAFNYRSVKALQKAGFNISAKEKRENTLYEVLYSAQKEPITAFSKKFLHSENPQENFAAIMTCSDADEACPFIPGADARFSVQYEDPKISDNTEHEEQVYDERCKEIAAEMFYLFSKVKQE